MFVLLFGAAGIYMFLGDRVEALFLLASVAGIVGITIYQERKTERVLGALRDLSSPRALVIRDGTEVRIPGREVVVDDLLIVREGDRVTADARLLDCVDLRVDESLITGESVPVVKRVPPPIPPQTEARDAHVYAGTLVVKGQGIACVTATGSRSEIGRIGKSLEGIGVEATSLQIETRRLVRMFSMLALLLCLLLVVVYVLNGGEWLDAVLAGLTLAMAILPEEFPVVLTVFLALGAWRMTRVDVLTRRVASIEALGAATVLCVDKTGTLTQNRMAVRSIHAQGRSVDIEPGSPTALPAEFAETLRISVLASEPSPFDPMERAFHALHGDREKIDAELVHRYPLSSALLVVTHVWRHDGSARVTVAAKGAPESVAALCRLSPTDALGVEREAALMAQSGLRVLGVAKAERDATTLPSDPRELEPQFLGLIGLADPLRPSVPAAMRECRDAGIRVVMITGDFPATAAAIARESGLAAQPAVVSGAELDAMSDDELAARLPAIDVFARVVPAQKLRIVTALKAQRHVVAMTGDGVNDAPALKAADIGIAMGSRGTDVAREAASLVLLDDDFGSIVRAVRQGRRIFDNLRKAMSYLVSVHIPIAGLGLLPVMLGGPPLLFPAHVVFLEFVIDPACSIAFEAEPAEPDVMRRPPRFPGQRLVGGLPLVLATLEGALALLFAMGVYWTGLAVDSGEQRMRMLVFSAIFIANLSLIFFARSGGRRVWRHIVAGNRSLWLIVLGTVAAYAVVLASAPMRDIFRLAAPTVADAIGLAVATLVFWAALALLNVACALSARHPRRIAPKHIR